MYWHIYAPLALDELTHNHIINKIISCVLFDYVQRAWFLYVIGKFIPQCCAGDLETKVSNIQTGKEYIQFTSIAYTLLVRIVIYVPYKETIEDVRVISIQKLIHENADSISIDITYS